MINLFNGVVVFGKTHENWNAALTKGLLLTALIILSVIAVILLVRLILLLSKRKSQPKKKRKTVVSTAAQQTANSTEVIYVHEQKAEEERVLTGISLDLGVVPREFVEGDAFTCQGLVVHAEYNVKPTTESFVEYTLIDSNTYARLEKRGKTHGVYVIEPDMSVGVKVVTVYYKDQTTAYTISVNEQKVEEAKPTVQETVVVEKIVEVEPKIRELLSISLDTDNVQKDYTAGDTVNHEGLVVTAHYSAEPFTETVTDYSVLAPDMNKTGKPTVTVTYQDMMVGYQITINPAPQVEEAPQEVVEQHQYTLIDPVIIEEESLEAGTLRYDKSFTARFIQSDDEIKLWYTEIKNEILSYKKISDRVSWRFETFRWHRDPVAKVAFRGKTLCLYLPLTPADYIEKYHVEDESDSVSYVETPLMIRIKNNRRVKIAKLLIAEVMKQKGIEALEHQSVDYYIPYEGIVELIKKGLIKRIVRSKEQEAFFKGGVVDTTSEDQEDETFGLEKVVAGIYVTKKDK